MLWQVAVVGGLLINDAYICSNICTIVLMYFSIIIFI